MPLLSIIIPCYRNEASLPHSIRRLLANEKNFPEEVEIEYVMVDDGSPDGTLQALTEFHETHPQKVTVVKLTRNVGSYNAILAGMEVAKGDCCAVISADLQDPPELLPEMMGHWLKGIKLVIANRNKRDDPWPSHILAGWFHKLIRKFGLPNLPRGGFDFVLFDRELKERVVKMQEKNTNVLYLLLWLGYPYLSIPYEREARAHGTSSWTFKKRLKLFVDSFVAFSFAPIRVISVLGLSLGLLAFVYALFIISAKLFGWIRVEGWTTVMVVMLTVSSFQMIALGILGEYVWRTLDASRRRPNYVIESVSSPSKPEQA